MQVPGQKSGCNKKEPHKAVKRQNGKEEQMMATRSQSFLQLAFWPVGVGGSGSTL